MIKDIPEEDQNRLIMGDAVISELKQFDKLCAILPLLTCAEIAHRMAWGKRATRWLLTKNGDKRT